MYTEYLVVDDHAQREIVEHICKVVPNIGISVFPSTLGVEAIGLSNAAGLVVAPNQVDSVRITELETNEERNGLHTKETTVDIVT